MKTTLINFHSTDGLILDGVLFEPKTKTNKIVIHVHGSAGNYYNHLVVSETLSNELIKRGVSLLVFNNRGAEPVKYFYKQDEKLLIGQQYENFDECICDIQGAIDFAKRNGYTDIVLSGHSFGCNKIIWYTINNLFMGDLILMAPCDIPSLRKELQRNDYEYRGPTDMFRYNDWSINSRVSALRNNILTIVAGDDGYIVQDKNQVVKYFEKIFSNGTVKLIENANHNFEGDEDLVVEKIMEFLGIT